MNFHDFSKLLTPGQMLQVWIPYLVPGAHPGVYRVSSMHDGTEKELVLVIANLRHPYILNDHMITLLTKNGMIIEQSLLSWYDLVVRQNISFQVVSD